MSNTYLVKFTNSLKASQSFPIQHAVCDHVQPFNNQ